MSVVSDRLRELRGPTSQSEMARTLGIVRQQWIKYETGQSAPGADMLAHICRVHACSADWLLGLERGGSAATTVTAGAGAAVAIGAHAQAAVRGGSAAPGDAPICAMCPYKESVDKFAAVAASLKRKKVTRK